MKLIKPDFSLLLLVCGTLIAGCTCPSHRPNAEIIAGALTVRVTSLLGMQGDYRSTRIYVDGRFVGHYEADETVLYLPPGAHTVRVEIPRVYDRRELPNGNTQIRTYALTGEEEIRVLGRDSKQSLVFNSENLKRTEIKDEDGH